MKRIVLAFLSCVLAFGVSGGSMDGGSTVVQAFERPSADLSENLEEVTLRNYYEMSDGTWRTDEHTYQYRLVITGRLNNAVRDVAYTILSNTEDISFEQAWKASGLSSDLDDYFKVEDAVIVAIK